MSPLLAEATAERDGGAAPYQRHRSEHPLLYRIVEQHYPAFLAHMAQQEHPLPDYVQQEFEDYLRCGQLEQGFLRVRCDTCHAEHRVAFSCKRRGFCPSCGARRMTDSAALLVDEVLPEQPVRQWVLSFPYPLRFLFASRPAIKGQVLGIVYPVIAGHLIKQAGFTCKTARTGAVTLIQRFGGALNLNLHFHMLFLEGFYVEGSSGPVCIVGQGREGLDKRSLTQSRSGLGSSKQYRAAQSRLSTKIQLCPITPASAAENSGSGPRGDRGGVAMRSGLPQFNVRYAKPTCSPFPLRQCL